jgi:hypothetical protein
LMKSNSCISLVLCCALCATGAEDGRTASRLLACFAEVVAFGAMIPAAIVLIATCICRGLYISASKLKTAVLFITYAD